MYYSYISGMKFRGIAFTPFKIVANLFDGFGFSLLSLQINTKGKICTITHRYTLLAVNYQHESWFGEEKCNMLYITVCGFGFKAYRKVLEVKEDEDEFEWIDE